MGAVLRVIYSSNRQDLAGWAVARQIIAALQVDPKLGRRTQCLGKQPGRVWSYTALATHDFIDALNRRADMSCKSHLAQPKGDEKFLQQNFARMGRNTIFGQHRRILHWHHDLPNGKRLDIDH